MSRASRVIYSVYLLLARACPPSFRIEFEAEMSGIFASSLADAEKNGAWALVKLCWREARDWPKSVWSEHWRSAKALRRGLVDKHIERRYRASARDRHGRTIVTETQTQEVWTVRNRRHAIVAALPPLLAGLGVGLMWLIIGGPWHTVPSWRLYLGAAVGLTPFTVLGLGGTAALVRRVPDWGYAWAGGALMGFALLVKTLAEEGAEVGRQYLISQAGDAALVVLVLLAGFAVLAVAAIRGWAQAGLVSIGLSSTMWLSLCAAVAGGPFHRYAVAISAAPLGLAAAALTYTYVRGTTLARAGVLAAMEILNVTVILVANSVWESWLAPQGKSTPLIPLLVLSTGVLLAGPVLGLVAKPIQRTLQRA